VQPKNPNRLAAAATSIKTVWSGVKTLDHWIDSGEPAVEYERSSGRAEICASCPRNTSGDFTKWFTKPASETIRKQLERVQERKLSTPFDDKLNVCDVCLCPMKLKVHTPIQFIKQHKSEETLALLKSVPNCWIPAELST
jgi:hypothetical protein